MSLWKPLPLELSECQQYCEALVSGQQGDQQAVCQVRHPIAVCWLMKQLTTTPLNPKRGERFFDLLNLFNILRGYVLSGVAHFKIGRLEVEKPASLVRGTGSGPVVDYFNSLVVMQWSLKGRRRPRREEECVYDVVRCIVDALFPRSQHEEDLLFNKEAFLWGFAPMSTIGVHALTRLLVVREGLDKRRTAVVGHVISLLKLERLREAARRVAACDVAASGFEGAPNAPFVEIGAARLPADVKALLLFHLRAFVAAIRFVNPLGWHGERQSVLDTAYTALLGFLFLYCQRLPTLGDVDIMTNEIEQELTLIFGSNVRQVIQVARLTERSNVTIAGLLSFLCGEWKREHEEKRKAEARLRQELMRMLKRHVGDAGAACDADVLFIKDEENDEAPSSLRASPLAQVHCVLQKALCDSAVMPSHGIVLEILDAVTTTDVNDVSVIFSVLQSFVIAAPYMVVTTMMLEKVMLVLLAALRHPAISRYDGVCGAVLDLILRRYQYVGLNTPSGVAMMFELYSILASRHNDVSVKGNAIDGTSCSSSGWSCDSEQLNHLLWRCVVEADRVERASLEVALSVLHHNALVSVQRACLLFLTQGHNKPHYDPPFLRLGRMLDLLLLQQVPTPGSHNDFTVELLRLLQERATATPMGRVTGVNPSVPWRRILLFMPCSDGGERSKKIRSSLFVLVLQGYLMVPGENSDVVRNLWREALTCILGTVSTEGSDGMDHEDVCKATEVALRTIHYVSPPHQWELALVLTQRLSTAFAGSRLRLFQTHYAVVMQTLQYLVRECDLASVPVPLLLSFLHLVKARQYPEELSEVDNISASPSKRAQMLCTFIKQIQHHPYLTWVGALDVLHAVGCSGGGSPDVSQEVSAGNADCVEASLVLSQVKCDLVSVVLNSLYKRQSYEQLLRFAEAVQRPPYSERIRGRAALQVLKHAASFVFPLGPNSNGPSEVLMLLSGTSSERTLDAMLRERSSAALMGKERLLQDLLRNHQCSDAAVVVRDEPEILRSPGFHDACRSLLHRFHHNIIVYFYDELLHVELGREQQSEATVILPRSSTQLSLLENLTIDALQLALTAVEVSGNSTRGLDERSQMTGVLIAAAWLKARARSHATDVGPFEATLRWVKRDVCRTADGPLKVLDDVVRETLLMKAATGTKGSPKNKDGVTDGISILIGVLKGNEAVARLLVEVLSGVFPVTTVELCTALLEEFQRQQSPDSTKKDDEWVCFLRCTNWYNASLHAGDEECERLSKGAMDVGKCNDVIMWRDRRLFGRDTSGKGEDWVAALAAYAAAQSRVGLPGINTPHVARLVRLLSQTSSLTVTIEVARRVFLDASGVALVRGDSRSSAAPLFLGVLSLLFCGIHTKKRAIIQKIGITLSDEELLPQLQDMLNELGILNSFIRSVLEKLQEKQSAGCLNKGDDVLGGHDELACHMIACLTLTTTPAKLDHAVPESVISPLEEWRTLLSYVLSATPSHQCNVAVLGALMEGVQDSVVVLNVLQKHPVPSFVSCDEAFKSLWCDALMIVSSREDLSRHFVNKDDVPRASRKGKFAADFLETLFQCASLTADKGLAAMRTICDSVVRPHSLTLSEEAESLLKMACINNSDEGGGFGWRAVYRSVKEGLPQAAQRHSHDMSVDEQEHLQQLSCLLSGGEPPTPESVEVLKILVERRTADVVLRGPHCRDVLDLLEKKAGKMKAAEVGDVIMHICFEQLRSGVAPHVRDVQQCVRILSREEVSPLLLLQYARAISLFPQLEDGSCTERGSPSPASHPARTTGVNSWTSPAKELPSLLTAVMIRTQAEFQRSSNVSTEEVNECIDMLSSLLQWIATLVRIPRFERNLMESIVTAMCTLVEKTPVTEEVEVTSKHDADERADKSSLRNDSGDIRELLTGTFIRLRDLEADGESSCPPKPLRNYYFYREPIGKRGCSGLGMAESSFPDADTFARLRRSALAAACLVKQQMSLHRTLDISLPLLCRTFAAAVAGTSLEESSVAVGVLSEIAQDERLISPPVRSLLILTVAEQCVVWNLACSRSPSTVQVGEIPPATVVRAVSHTHNAVRLQFAPRNAIVLSELLVPSKNTACSGEYDVSEDRGEPGHAHKTCGGIARCTVPASLGSTYAEEEESDELSCFGHNANSLLWEKSLKLFGVLAANANSDADLSLPFTKLVEILCHSGQWGLACQCVVQAIARSDRSTKHPSRGILGTVVGGKLGSTSGSAGVEISCLLQRHVVVDAFLLERLVTTIEAERRRRQYEHVIAHGSVAGHPSGFWYLALDALGSQEVFIRQSFDQADGKRNSEKDLFLTSPSILAIMKKICTR